MCTMVIEAPTPFDRTLRIKMYKNIARSRLFCRIAKRSIIRRFQNEEDNLAEHLQLFISFTEGQTTLTVYFRTKASLKKILS